MVNLVGAVRRKSSRSSGNGNCAEVAVFDGAVAVRDSISPDGGAVVLAPGVFAGFVAGVRAGVFDV